MNFYFMPRIQGIKTTVTLANFASMEPHIKDMGLTPQYVHITWADGKTWRHEVIDSIPINGVLTYDSACIPSSIPEDATPFLYMHPTRQEAKTDKQITAPHMYSLPSWRGNIKLSSQLASTSYQGEYPGEMLAIQSGSFTSVNPMLQMTEGVVNKMIFVNMCSEPSLDLHSMVIASSGDGKIHDTQQVRANSCSVIDLGRFPRASNELMVLACGSLAGIPIYWSHAKDYSEMSLEHTHPPVSSVIFGNSIEFQKHMKSHWLAKLLS